MDDARTDDTGPWFFETKARRDPYLVNKTVFCNSASRYAVRDDMTADEARDCLKRQFESLPTESREDWLDRRFSPNTSTYDTPVARVVTVYESPPVRNTVLGCRRRW